MLGLTFLGKGNYSTVTYEFLGKGYNTHLFPSALVNFFTIEKLFIVLTEEAKEKHYDDLVRLIKDKVDYKPIEVQYGKGEEDLWDMFDKIVNEIPEESELVVDVTHGFRAQPILALSICIYLRMVRNVEISHIVYGAFEAKDKNCGKAPVWDLTPFLMLMDWNIALNKFSLSGNATELSRLLESSHRKARKEAMKDSAFLPTKLQNLGRRILSLSNALTTVRTFETIENASSLINSIDTTEEEVEKWAKPFLPPLHQVKREYFPLRVNKNHRFEVEALSAQFAMIQWYWEKKHYQQAATLAREWMVSKMCIFTYKNPENFEDREELANELGNWSSRFKNGHKVEGETKGISNQELASIWALIAQVRNDMNHAGMRTNPMPAKTIIKKIKDICKGLERIEYQC